MRQSSDFLPGIFYLGACYAAGGRGREAVGAWQTSLVGDDSSPDVFQLLIDGFLRIGDTDAAIGAIEEASAKWPDDYRFVLRATLAQAAQDKPADALERLRPWLDKQAGDREALDLALRLALADLATRPSGDEQDAVARLKDLTARYEASGTPVAAGGTRGSPTWPRARPAVGADLRSSCPAANPRAPARRAAGRSACRP